MFRQSEEKAVKIKKRDIGNLLFFLSGLCVLVSGIYDTMPFFVGICFLFPIFLGVSLLWKRIHLFLHKSWNQRIAILCLLLSAAEGSVCYAAHRDFFLTSAFIQSISTALDIPVLVLNGVCSVLSGICSSYFFAALVCAICHCVGSNFKKEQHFDHQKSCHRFSRTDYLFLCALLISVLIAGIYFLSQKSGYHCDELYTLTLSNGYYQPFVDLPDGDTYLYMNGESYLELIEADHPFCYTSVFYNQIQDVHPPLYYLIIHTFFSVFPFLSYHIIGFCVNFIFLCTTLICIFIWMRFRFGKTASWTASVGYAACSAFYSELMYFRMYAMLTCFVVILGILLYEYYRTKQQNLLPAIGTVLILGGLTQYYFFIFAFFAVFFLFLLLIFSKRGTQIKTLFICISASAGIYYGLWGSVCINHMLSGYRGQEAFQNAVDGSDFISRLAVFTELVLERLSSGWTGIVIFLSGIGITIIAWFLLRKRSRGRRIGVRTALLFFTLPAMCDFFVIVKIAPYASVRYFTHLVPYFWIMFGVALVEIISQRLVCNICLAFLLALEITHLSPEYLFLDTKNVTDYLASCGEETTAICYLSQYGDGQTYIINYLCQYKEVYVVNNQSVESLSDANSLFQSDKSILLAVVDDENLKDVLNTLDYENALRIGRYAWQPEGDLGIAIYKIWK